MYNKTLTRYVKEHLPKRKKNAHKGDCGRVLIIAGSVEMPGAAILSAKAAFRTGTGLVYMVVPKQIKGIINTSVPEAIVSTDFDIAKIQKMNADVILMGPGLGIKMTAFIKRMILAEEIEIPMILDADALNSIADDPAILLKRTAATIITPHAGEMSRLTRIPANTIELTKKKVAMSFARKYNVITVLKGSHTVISGPEHACYENTTGNPGMATAGAGDVLAGVIASLIGQGCKVLEAAVCGVYIHGLAGDMAAENIGKKGIMASDLIEFLPKANEKEHI